MNFIKTIRLNDEFYLRIELDNWILGVSLERNILYGLKKVYEKLSIVIGEYLLPVLQESWKLTDELNS